jgi:nicotinamide-nucleotide amidase
MRVTLLNTGTELLLGDVQDAHLAFIAREIFPLGLRIEERRTVGDTEAIRVTLAELLSRCEILFVTGGLGPTSDDITREMVADLLGLELRQSPELKASLRQRLRVRGIKWTSGIALFLLPGPPRELQPMFRAFAIPILRSIVPVSALIERRLYKIANKGESLVEEAIGDDVLAIPGVELGYCARPGEVEVRIVGKSKAIEQADAIIRSTLGPSIFSAADETLEEVIIQLLAKHNQTLTVAESCTGGLLANRITNVPGASAVFLAGYVCYANQAKTNMLNVDPQLIEKHGAVSDQVARALAEHARACAKSDYALATTGVAGPGGGSPEKPVGTVHIALAASGETTAKKFFFPTDRETFKQITTQAALELLRRKLLKE